MGFQRKRRRVYQDRRRALPVLFAVLGAILVVNLLASLAYDISALEVILSAKFGAPGFTQVSIPPIGSIIASTHPTPIQLIISLQNVDLDILRSITAAGDQGLGELLVEDIRIEATRVLRVFALKFMALAGLGGIFGVFLLGYRSVIPLARGLMIGLLLSGIMVGLTYTTYDANPFEHPEYRGIVEAAPWMVSLIQESVIKVEELGEQIQLLASNLYTAFQRIEDLKAIGIHDASLTVLHVSDIHNNPIAYDFARQIVSSFPVDFIIDTGDLTDWGTPLEAEIVSRIQQLDVTYVFTSGNHEAPDVLERLRRTENVVMIDNGEQQVHGLRIAGIGDAAAKSISPQPVAIDYLADTARWINTTYGKMERPPHVFGVHNHRIATAIEPGVFPLVLYGHNHKQLIAQHGQTVFINAGTTGAAGIRGLQSKEPIPFSLALLYFRYDEEQKDYKVIAVDGISVQGLEASISLERIFISPAQSLIEEIAPID